MLANAMRICEAKFGIAVSATKETRFAHVAMHNAPPAFAETRRAQPYSARPGRRAWPRSSRRSRRSISPTCRPSRLPRPRSASRSRSSTRRRPDRRCRADAQGRRAGRRRSPSIARRFGRSPTSRSSWSRTLPRRPSSPSRTPACSTSCANRCSSRPPPPTCSRSSAARPSICRRCSIRWSSWPRGFARRIGRHHSRRDGRSFLSRRQLWLPAGIRRVHAGSIAAAGRGSSPGGPRWRANPFIFPMCWPIPSTPAARRTKLAATARCSACPLLREGTPIGVLVLTRSQVRPSPTSKSSWSTTFADQAVIAIENVRLFDEVQARTRELSEALEQQTATSEVLQVISSSPGELEPVFQAMLANATRICEAKFGILSAMRRRSASARRASWTPAGVRREQWREAADSARPGTGLGRVAATKQPVHIADLRAEQRYRATRSSPIVGVELAECGPARRPDAQGRRAGRRHRASTARRCGRSPTSRSSWCRTSPPRPSSPSRTRGCSTSCAAHRRSADAGAADRHRRRAQGHFQLARRTAAGVRCHAGDATDLRSEIRCIVAVRSSPAWPSWLAG